MKKNIFISYSAKYKKNTEKQIKQVEKLIMAQMLKDLVFSTKLLTVHQAKSNKIKVQKIVKLLVLNLIRAIHNNSELIISLDNNTLRQNNINLRLFGAIVDKLEKMDYITIAKGFFIGSDKISKRSRITATDKLKTLIIQHTTEYTQVVTTKLAAAKKVAFNGVSKVKLTFKDINSNATWSCFRAVEYITTMIAEHGTQGIKNATFKLKLNGNKIAEIIKVN